MKNKPFSALIPVVIMLMFSCMSAYAQPNMEDWKAKMQSGKIAFLTMEIGLTPEEAQSFWPIYNKVSEDLDKAMHDTFVSYMELEKALNTNKSEKDISKCLEKYLDALESQNDIRNESVSKYKKILSEKKVAKVFVAEEKFRRQHIRMLQHGGPQRQGQANR